MATRHALQNFVASATEFSGGHSRAATRFIRSRPRAWPRPPRRRLRRGPPPENVAGRSFQEGRLDVTRQGRTISRMDHGKKKFSGSREAAKKGLPLSLVIALAAAGGVVIGSAGTYFLSRPPAAPMQSAPSVAGGTTQAPTFTMPPQKQFTPAPQPPGEVPPGKVWSVEHGHWHDAPGALTTPAPAPPTVIPAAPPPPAPAAVPAEKKQ